MFSWVDDSDSDCDDGSTICEQCFWNVSTQCSEVVEETQRKETSGCQLQASFYTLSIQRIVSVAAFMLSCQNNLTTFDVKHPALFN